MKGKNRRKVDVLVLSDVHLGTYGCHAKELLCYLQSIKPRTVVLNGDIIDIWQFSKSYWPKSHMKIIKYLMHWMTKGVKIYYVTGNHDEMLRKFLGFKMGSFCIVNKVVLDLSEGKKAWFFHGDVFDVTMQHSKWLAKMGAAGYDGLILINRFVNFMLEKVFGKARLSFSRKIKNSVKGAVKFINNFEQTAADIGISNKYDFVVCGHIHQPEIREIENPEGKIMYLNSGDWIENLSALEYADDEWRLYRFDEEEMKELQGEPDYDEEMDSRILFTKMVAEFDLMRC